MLRQLAFCSAFAAVLTVAGLAEAGSLGKAMGVNKGVFDVKDSMDVLDIKGVDINVIDGKVTTSGGTSVSGSSKGGSTGGGCAPVVTPPSCGGMGGAMGGTSISLALTISITINIDIDIDIDIAPPATGSVCRCVCVGF
ncbi:MAG: hypothetical protein AAGJ46_16305 [Planctomycetota bacterium]